MTNKIRPPWTSEQVAALNEFQRRGGMHPFTCGAEHAPGRSPILDATHSGWICPDPACHYTQDWAHAFMADQTTGPEQPPAQSEAQAAVDALATLQTMINRVREAIGTDEPAPVRQRADCTELEWAQQERARFERLYTREYTRAERAEATLAKTIDGMEALIRRARRAEGALDRMRDRLEVTRVRIRELRDDLRDITGARWIADILDTIHDEPAPGPAATQATEPEDQHTGPLIPPIITEAIRQMDADPHGLKAGMIVKPYHDHGHEKWVFRCWGTDRCDGWLSLDHHSRQSAEHARDRHVAEEHQENPVPKPVCTATIEGPHVPGGKPVQCTREAGHPENHVGPKQGDWGKTLWSDHHAGATPHKAISGEQPS
ncbi:hypothetical protein [Streptomyces shenzhenensis]|uniref:hypothetical protein n=1 Tax=Streptomyces shenzhenensis TaxID=943815 RepID=UPI0036C09BA7